MSGEKKGYSIDVVDVIRMKQSTGYEPLDGCEKIVGLLGETVRSLDQDTWAVVYTNPELCPIGAGFVRDAARTNDVAAGLSGIMREAVLSSAYGIIALHCHPKGWSAFPTREDERMCSIINSMFSLFNITLVDCIILSGMDGREFYSWRSRDGIAQPVLAAESDFWDFDFSDRMDFAGMIGAADKPATDFGLEHAAEVPFCGDAGLDDKRLFQKEKGSGSPPRPPRKGGMRL